MVVLGSTVAEKQLAAIDDTVANNGVAEDRHVKALFRWKRDGL